MSYKLVAFLGIAAVSIFYFFQKPSLTDQQKEQATINYYEDKADDWLRLHGIQAKPSPALQKFAELLPAGTVLEIGCGGGADAQWFIDHGYQYTGTDVSSQFINYLQQELPRGTFLQQNVLDLDFSACPFDGFWCKAVLMHLSPNNVIIALRNIYKSIKPGAIGFITMKEGSGDHLDPQTGRYFYLYSLEQFSTLLEDVGFTIVTSSVKSSSVDSWMFLFVQKPK